MLHSKDLVVLHVPVRVRRLVLLQRGLGECGPGGGGARWSWADRGHLGLPSALHKAAPDTKLLSFLEK